MGIAIVFAALWMVPSAGQASPPSSMTSDQVDPQEARLNQAITAIQQGKAAEASSLLDPVLAAYETRYAAEKRRIYCGANGTETLLYMGMAASEKVDAVAIHPNWCTALYLKAFALIDLKQIDAGLPYLRHAVAMAPYHAHFLNELGNSYQTLRQWPEAIAAYDKAEAGAGFAASKDEQRREQARAWRGKGFVFVEQGKWDEAAAMYRQCLKLDPGDDTAKGELKYIAENRPKSS